VQIGTVLLDRPLALAPMEDVSDGCFRRICKKLGADLVYTEFTHCEALVRDVEPALRKIRVTDEERPVGIQIYGSGEASMEQAAAIAEQAGPDFIDINCGCWVKKVALRGDGAGLLRDLNKFESVVQSVIQGTDIPVTVKTRLGWDQKQINILETAQMLEQLGVQALTVHCRTRDQGHKGEADWNWLEELKRTVSIPIIGNGDVMTPEDARRMFNTGCDGVMIGRGSIQNPWIFQQTKHYLMTGEFLDEPSVAERVDICLEHLRMAVELKGEKHGNLSFRKHYSGYLKGLPSVVKLRSEIMQFVEYSPIEERLRRYVEETSLMEAA